MWYKPKIKPYINVFSLWKTNGLNPASSFISDIPGMYLLNFIHVYEKGNIVSETIKAVLEQVLVLILRNMLGKSEQAFLQQYINI